MESIFSYIKMYSLDVIGAILIILIGFKVAKYFKAFILKVVEKKSIDATLSGFIADILYFLILIVVIAAALSNLGVNVTSFIALLGAIGLAVGLALKDSISNIGASILIMVFRPFKVGDFITGGGESGTVETINLFSTILKTPDNKVITIPNASVIGGSITNFSEKETRRVDFTFGVSYDDDIKKVKNILQNIVEDDQRVLKDPAPLVAVSELADSSVNFVVRAWVKSPDYWSFYFETIERVKIRFDEESVTIPFPQIDIRSQQK